MRVGILIHVWQFYQYGAYMNYFYPNVIIYLMYPDLEVPYKSQFPKLLIIKYLSIVAIFRI